MADTTLRTFGALTRRSNTSAGFRPRFWGLSTGATLIEQGTPSRLRMQSRSTSAFGAVEVLGRHFLQTPRRAL